MPGRCRSSKKYPAVRGQKDPETGGVLEVVVYCQGNEGHAGPHWNGTEGGKGAHTKEWTE